MREHVARTKLRLPVTHNTHVSALTFIVLSHPSSYLCELCVCVYVRVRVRVRVRDVCALGTHPLLGYPARYCSSSTLQYASLSLLTRLPCLPLAIGSLCFNLPHRLHLGSFFDPAFSRSGLTGGFFTFGLWWLG